MRTTTSFVSFTALALAACATPPPTSQPAAPVIVGGYGSADLNDAGVKAAQKVAVDAIYTRNPTRALVEKAFGLTLRELVFDFGGGTRSGRPVKAIQVGGPLGAYVPESQWDLPLDYEAYAAVGAVVGHGGIVVHDDTADMQALARYAMEFCALESCGKCTPCRIGSVRGVELIDRLLAGGDRTRDRSLLDSLCDTMIHGSQCALGGMAPLPVQSLVKHFPDAFGLAPAAD